jgi:pimeloyl-ACP methyl ester carboxylesterase
MLVHPGRLADQKLVSTITKMVEKTGKEAFVREERAIMNRADSLPLLRSIGCPTLVLCGRQDALTPILRHEEMARAIAGSKLEIIEDCGHLSTLERPVEVNAALRRWLAVELRSNRGG